MAGVECFLGRSGSQCRKCLAVIPLEEGGSWGIFTPTVLWLKTVSGRVLIAGTSIYDASGQLVSRSQKSPSGKVQVELALDISIIHSGGQGLAAPVMGTDAPGLPTPSPYFSFVCFCSTKFLIQKTPHHPSSCFNAKKTLEENVNVNLCFSKSKVFFF